MERQKEKWEVLHFPAVDTGGAALWPERWTAEKYDEVKAEVGPRVWEALYQGRPVPDEGGLFKRDWLKTVDHAPNLRFWVRYWDLAASTKETGDWTVGARVGVDENNVLWVSDVIRFRAEWPEARRRILETVKMDGPNTYVGVEKSGFQLAAVQDLRNNDEFLRVKLYEIRPDKDKKHRASAWAARAAEDRLALCAAPWNPAFIDECLVFPYGTHDDQVDAVSGAVSLLYQIRGGYKHEKQPPAPGTWAYYQALNRLFGADADDEDETEDVVPASY